jgi:hypothetical protein
VTNWYESRIDRQIREAQERGDFDDLPGLGQPIPDRGELYDENWWVKDLIRRENLTGIAPGTLQVRKDIENLAEKLAGESFESSVRRIVTDLNQRIDQARRGLLDGPAVSVEPLDVDAVVAAWRARPWPATA